MVDVLADDRNTISKMRAIIFYQLDDVEVDAYWLATVIPRIIYDAEYGCSSCIARQVDIRYPVLQVRDH
jgi:hypothetical protein